MADVADAVDEAVGALMKLAEFESADGIPTVDEVFPRNLPSPSTLKPPVEHRLFTYQISARPPTHSRDTLKDWDKKYDWGKRAAIFDAQTLALQTSEHREVMNQGLSMPFERTRALKQLLEISLRQLLATDDKGNLVNYWIRDVKMVGAGLDAYPVTVTRFNSPLMNAVRGLMDDIAKEGGGRQSNLDGLLKELPWERLPDRFTLRMATDNPKEVLLAMIDEVCETSDEENVDDKTEVKNDGAEPVVGSGPAT